MKLFEFINRLWRGSIRRQLVLGFALSSLLLMLGFGYLILKQQRDALFQSSEERATSLAHALSISGTSWALANDLVGLQEVVQGFARTTDLQRAYFLNLRGEVLASTIPNEIGFFVTDALSLRMLASTARDQIVLANNGNQIVIAHPVMAEGRYLGWVRVEMTRDTVNRNLAALIQTWLWLLLLAVLVVTLVALVLSRRLTRGLNHLMHVAAEIERGEAKRRADVGRADEIGTLARHLDRMLAALEQQNIKLAESEARYRFLAENISDVIWILNLEHKRWEYISPSIYKLRGYTAEEVMAQSLEQVVTPRFYPEVQKWMQERARLFMGDEDGLHTYTDEMEQPCRDGSTVWTEMTTHFSRNEMGELILLGVSRNITERKIAEEQIRHLAFYDPLTRLPNRRLLQDRFKLVLSACKRNTRFAALMFLDLDNFKPLNDEYGHDVGDILLVQVANRIVGCVREIDTVARFGGDEFVVMLGELDSDRNVSAKQASAVAEKIRQILGETYRLPVVQEDTEQPRTVEHHCTASIGLVLFNHHGAIYEELLKQADDAMYRAKAAGRNQICFADN